MGMGGSLINKTILITGGSRGIGKATAFAFAQEGARVCINFHNNSQAAKETIDSLPGEGHFAAKADISDPNSAQQLMGLVTTEFGRLDVLVNNAGIYVPHPVSEIDYYEWQIAWQEILSINLIGAANLCYLAARQMMNQGGGHIINVSSRGAFRGEPENTAYGASKAGLNSLTQSLAVELGKYHIYVTAVAPGFVETDMAKDLLESPAGKGIKQQSPLGRVATAEEVANVILFLASEKAAFLTGAIIDVNGASYLRS